MNNLPNLPHFVLNIARPDLTDYLTGICKCGWHVGRSGEKSPTKALVTEAAGGSTPKKEKKKKKEKKNTTLGEDEKKTGIRREGQLMLVTREKNTHTHMGILFIFTLIERFAVKSLNYLYSGKFYSSICTSVHDRRVARQSDT